MGEMIGDKVHSYIIDGKKYVQKPLVWGQIWQLIELLGDVSIPINTTPMMLIALLGKKLPMALAIVLTEEGQSPEKKDLESLAEKINFAITPERMVEIIDDFLECNQLFSLLEQITAVIQKISLMASNGSKKSALSSPEETLRNVAPSSGVTPQ